MTNKSKKVTDFIEDLDYTMKVEIELVRTIILSADHRIKEDIKWSAPTFIYKGNIATFNLRSKKHVTLTFHKGAMVDDGSGILEGNSKEARVARFKDKEAVIKKQEALKKVVHNWVELKDKNQ